MPSNPAGESQKLTLYMPREVVKDLKRAAIDDDTSVSRILSELAQRWLAQRAKKSHRDR